MIHFHQEAATALEELNSKTDISNVKIKYTDDWFYDERKLKMFRDNEIKHPFPESCFELCLQPVKTKLDWRHNDLIIGGHYDMMNVRMAILLSTSNLRGYDEVFDEREVSPETRELFRKARHFDYIEGFGYSCIIKEDDESADMNSIWFMEEDDLEFRKLDLDLETYYKTMFTLKGASYWQFLFFERVLKEDYIDRYYMEHICRWITYFPETFPDHDYSAAFNRYKLIAAKYPNEKDIDKTNERLMKLGLW